MAANGSQNQDAPNQGGLYKHVKMSVRSANILVGVLLAALVIEAPVFALLAQRAYVRREDAALPRRRPRHA